MKRIFFIIILLLVYACSKPKTVLICGDHVCINKEEAEQYFQDNLTLEVRIIGQKEKENINLVELNLNSDSKGKKQVKVFNKKETKKKLKVLSDSEIKEKKEELKKRKKIGNKNNKDTKKIAKIKLKDKKEKKKIKKDIIKINKNVNKPNKEIVDICTVLEKCSIDEISKYLIREGKKKKFPDITLKE